MATSTMGGADAQEFVPPVAGMAGGVTFVPPTRFDEMPAAVATPYPAVFHGPPHPAMGAMAQPGPPQGYSANVVPAFDAIAHPMTMPGSMYIPGASQTPVAPSRLAYLQQIVGGSGKAVIGGTAATHAGILNVPGENVVDVDTLPVIHIVDTNIFQKAMRTLKRGFTEQKVDHFTALFWNDEGGLVVVHLLQHGEVLPAFIPMAGVAQCVSIDHDYEIAYLETLEDKGEAYPRLAHAAKLVLTNSIAIAGGKTAPVSVSKEDLLSFPVCAEEEEEKEGKDTAPVCVDVEAVKADVDAEAVKDAYVHEIRATVDEAEVKETYVQEIRASVDEAEVKETYVHEIRHSIDAAEVKEAYVHEIRATVDTSKVKDEYVHEIRDSVDDNKVYAQEIQRVRGRVDRSAVIKDMEQQIRQKEGKRVRRETLQKMRKQIDVAALRAEIEAEETSSVVADLKRRIEQMEEDLELLSERNRVLSSEKTEIEQKTQRTRETLKRVNERLVKTAADKSKRDVEVKRAASMIASLQEQVTEAFEARDAMRKEAEDKLEEAERKVQIASDIADAMRDKHAELAQQRVEVDHLASAVYRAYGSVEEGLSPGFVTENMEKHLRQLKLVLGLQKQVADHVMPHSAESAERLRDIVDEHASRGDYFGQVTALEVSKGGYYMRKGQSVLGVASIVSQGCQLAQAKLRGLMGCSLLPAADRQVPRLSFEVDHDITFDSFYEFFPISIRLVSVQQKPGMDHVEILDEIVDPDAAAIGHDPKDPSRATLFVKCIGKTSVELIEATPEGVDEACGIIQMQAAMLMAYLFAQPVDTVRRAADMGASIIRDVVSIVCTRKDLKDMIAIPHDRMDRHEAEMRKAMLPQTTEELVQTLYPDIPEDPLHVDMFKAIMLSQDTKSDEDILGPHLTISDGRGGKRALMRAGTAHVSLRHTVKQFEAGVALLRSYTMIGEKARAAAHTERTKAIERAETTDRSKASTPSSRKAPTVTAMAEAEAVAGFRKAALHDSGLAKLIEMDASIKAGKQQAAKAVKKEKVKGLSKRQRRHKRYLELRRKTEETKGELEKQDKSFTLRRKAGATKSNA